MYYVYILKLANKDFNIGRTDDLKRRIYEHKAGQVNTTKISLPIKLVNYIAFENKNKSIIFEKYLKSGSGIAFRKRHLV